jgi:hypothetical protein
MKRTVEFRLSNVNPTPLTLRANRQIDIPTREVDVDLGQLFLHYYFDSYPLGPPNPDPSQFEYLQLISSATDFRFHAHVANASLVKRRELSTDMGQAFCRLMLSDHFDIVHFAHMNDVLGKPAHAAFGGMRVERLCPGDVPDYLCVRQVTEPLLAEAKGRFSSISFNTAAFKSWRAQFSRIRIVDSANIPRSAKGYVVATQFVTDASAAKNRATSYIEDPSTEGQPLTNEQSALLGRGVRAVHYARIFNKLDLTPLALALNLGYALTRELTFQLPVWTCNSPPFVGNTYVGGYYRTRGGHIPTLTEKGWQMSPELGAGHAVFVGLETAIASRVAAAARGEWNALDGIEFSAPEGLWSSEFAWLRDGSIAAPLLHFRPTALMTL